MMQVNKMRKTLKIATSLLIVYLAVAGIFYWTAKEEIEYKKYNQVLQQGSAVIGEIVEGEIVEQDISFEMDYVKSIQFMVATYARTNTGKLCIELLDDKEQILVKREYDIRKLQDNSKLVFRVGKEVVTDDKYKIRMSTIESDYGNAITFYAADADGNLAKILRNSEPGEYSLYMAVYGGINSTVGQHYWTIIAIIGIVLFLITCWAFAEEKQERWGNRLLNHIRRYRFLVKQLVSRDFKTKYKRSTLGFCWSFLNPLLTMMVQYVVFSTIFRSNIDNFPVYLLSAGILFNFFTESVGGGLGAITGNAALITKVYVPKYIYPFSKVLSTSINLVISMVPLMLAVIITGEEITKAFFLIPFVFVCLIAFCAGMSLILSACMVFFRDTQFLWGIISLIWTYATPIFYPEEIIPQHFSFILKVNPMYHYLKFFRTILMEGVSPRISEYLYCIGFAVLFCLIGTIVFRKTQKKFVLYL